MGRRKVEVVYEPSSSMQKDYALVRDTALWFDSERKHWVALLQQAKALPKEVSLRLRWFIHYHTTAGENARLTCRYFGISPKTFYKWFKRFDPQKLVSLADQSRRPQRVRQRSIGVTQEQRIITLRKQFIRIGKDKLQILYTQRHGESISSWKIQKTIEKYQLYYHPAQAKKTRRKRLLGVKKKRISELQKQPHHGFLLQLDTIVKYWNAGKYYIFTAIDHTSKVSFARMYASHSSHAAADFLSRLHYLLDGHIENIQTDNGSEFAGNFETACTQLGLTHYYSRVRTPKDNAVNERFNRTLQEEFIDIGNFTPQVDIFNKNLTEWLVFYNFVRPHYSLNYSTPFQFASSLNHLLPMYPSYTSS
jgi:transposase InsO family protein